MNLLLGDISSYKAIIIAKFIRKNYPDYKIYSFDKRSFTKNVHTRYVDKHFLIKKYDVESFVKIINEYKIDYFIPVINESLALFWKYKNKFNKSLDYLGSFDTYEILNDKLKVHALAKELKIKVPERFDNLESAIVPFIIKPTNLSSAKGVIYVNDISDIPKGIASKNVIIQQYVKGKGVGYSFYCKKGEIIHGYGHKRLAEYPITGGTSTYRTNYNNQDLYIAANRMVKKLNYTGFAMFEFKLTDTNELYLLEVNPRIWGSINQGLTNGYNYFEGIFGYPKSEIHIKKKPVNTYIGPLIYLSFLKYFLRLNLNPIMLFIKNIFTNVPDVSLIYDPKGYLSTIFRKLSS